MGSFINDDETIAAIGGVAYGQALDCTQKLLVSAQMKIANPDTNTGSIALWVSNKADPILTTDADWVVTTQTTSTMTNALTILQELTDLPNKWVRIKLVDVEGGSGMTLTTDYSVKGF